MPDRLHAFASSYTEYSSCLSYNERASLVYRVWNDVASVFLAPATLSDATPLTHCAYAAASATRKDINILCILQPDRPRKPEAQLAPWLRWGLAALQPGSPPGFRHNRRPDRRNMSDAIPELFAWVWLGV